MVDILCPTFINIERVLKNVMLFPRPRLYVPQHLDLPSHRRIPQRMMKQPKMILPMILFQQEHHMVKLILIPTRDLEILFRL